VIAGIPFPLTVAAFDPYGNPTNYVGILHLQSSDSSASLPEDFPFSITDNGTRTFSVTLSTAGLQQLSVADKNVSVIGALETVTVQGIDPGVIQVTAPSLPSAAVTAAPNVGNVFLLYLISSSVGQNLVQARAVVFNSVFTSSFSALGGGGGQPRREDDFSWSANEYRLLLQVVAATGEPNDDQFVTLPSLAINTLPEVFGILPDGHYRVLYQQSQTAPQRLIYEVYIRQGRPVNSEDGSSDNAGGATTVQTDEQPEPKAAVHGVMDELPRHAEEPGRPWSLRDEPDRDILSQRVRELAADRIAGGVGSGPATDNRTSSSPEGLDEDAESDESAWAWSATFGGLWITTGHCWSLLRSQASHAGGSQRVAKLPQDCIREDR
jgi:hypothetical protein